MLLTEVYPRHHLRYSSLPIVGAMLAGYARWLFDQGYPKHRIRQHFRAARRLACLLQDMGAHVREDLTRERLRACAPDCSQDDPELTVFVRMLARYLEIEGDFPAATLTAIESRLAAYRTYLEEVRGLSPGTVADHSATIGDFLEHLGYEGTPGCIAGLNQTDIEGFVCKVGKRLGRASLQHSVAHLRAFLRFLAAQGEAPSGLDRQIDSPRIYREERLPRALPWGTIRTLLHSIDRSTPRGRRDYAMLPVGPFVHCHDW